MLIAALSAGLVAVGGCGDDDGVDPPVDSGTSDSGSPTDSGTPTDAGEDPDTGPDVDSGPVVASVTVEDQTLELSTLVTIAEAVSDGPGFIVIHAEQGDGPGPEILGNTALTSGTNTDIEVALNRPAVDGETLYAMLHTDDNTIGTYEFGDVADADGPVFDADEEVIAPPFDVTVEDGTPAVRINVTNIGQSDWDIEGTEPAAFAESIIGESESDDGGDQPITLTRGWRYEIVKTITGMHPWAFRTTVAEQLSQSSDGVLEGMASIGWEDDGDTFQFTVSAPFEVIDNYVCTSHNGMTGSVSYVDPAE